MSAAACCLDDRIRFKSLTSLLRKRQAGMIAKVGDLKARQHGADFLGLVGIGRGKNERRHAADAWRASNRIPARKSICRIKLVDYSRRPEEQANIAQR